MRCIRDEVDIDRCIDRYMAYIYIRVCSYYNDSFFSEEGLVYPKHNLDSLCSTDKNQVVALEILQSIFGRYHQVEALEKFEF